MRRLSPMLLALASLLLAACPQSGRPKPEPPPPAAPPATTAGPDGGAGGDAATAKKEDPDAVPSSEAWRKERPKPGQAPEIVTPKFEKTTLDNGFTVLVSTRKELPLVSLSLAFRAGSGVETADKAGLADLTYELMLEGAGKRDALQIADAFADLGTSAGISTGADGASLDLTVLKPNVDAVMALVASIVRKPNFKKKDFLRKRAERLADLARSVGEPSFLVRHAFLATLYGPEHPYGHLTSGTPETVAAIRPRDPQRFYKANVGPKTTGLVAAGDVTLEEAVAWAKKHFGKWKGKAKPPPEPPAPVVTKRDKIVLVPKKGLAQTVINVGRPAINYQHADEWPLKTANYVFGGSFSGRLNMNLREDKGYTYGAYSRVRTRRGIGYLSAGGQVRADVTGKSLAEVFSELKGMSERPISDEELQEAKDGIVRSVPGWFETVGGLAGTAGALFQHDLPLDRLDQVVKGHLGVDKAAAHKMTPYFNPDEMHVVMVGDPETVKAQVAELGLGEIVEREPPAGPAAADAPAARPAKKGKKGKKGKKRKKKRKG